MRAASIVLAAGLALFASPAAEAKQKGHVKFHPDWASQPSARYAAMSAPQCLKELDTRGIAHTQVVDAPGVLAPVRLTKDVGGVAFHTTAPAPQRATSPYDVFDCRLVLSLSDFSKVLKTHDVDEVLLFSAWRPPGKSWPKGKLGTRHPGGLAMDAMRFGKRTDGKKDKVWLDVAKDFHGRIGAVPCGPDASAPSPSTPEARELRSILCEAVDQHLFTAVLTPDYNHEHFNHFHLEVTPDVKWTLVR